MNVNDTAWLVAACLGVPSTLWLSWKWNAKFTLLDLVCAILVGLMLGPLPILAYWASKVTLRSEG